MRPEIKEAMKEIREDHGRGARQLARIALEALRTVADSATREELRECARALALARPMTAPILNALAWTWSRYLETGDAAGAVSEAIEHIETAPHGMAAAARGAVPTGTLITHSYSSSVVELLGRLKPRRVIVPEARPFNDGVRVAKELVRAGISATLITEAQMALFVHEADAVVVGAHTILPDGDFINKVGTRLLALAARDAEVPFYTVSETLKVVAPSEPIPFAPEEGKPREICTARWLEVRNVYFESTPARLVTAYVTEDGLLQAADIGRYALAAEQRWQALMNSAHG